MKIPERFLKTSQIDPKNSSNLSFVNLVDQQSKNLEIERDHQYNFNRRIEYQSTIIVIHPMINLHQKHFSRKKTNFLQQIVVRIG